MQSVKLSKVEKQAFKVMKITTDRNSVWGRCIENVFNEPTPERIKELFSAICEQWPDNPALMFEILGFFDLPKFLNARQ